jgi:tRNA (cytidine32/uridine32-2'-O)-methyltransferase
MDLGRVDVVLVRPARPANVAASARALKNMGVASLAIVDPPQGLDHPDARALAYGAWDLLDGARRPRTLRDAVGASTFVAGTSGRPHPQAWTPRQLAEEGPGRMAAGRLAVVFGPEASGLRDDELAQCHVRVHIPADPVHPSLNLAQAVLLVAYELRVAALARKSVAGAGGAEAAPERASTGEIEAAMDDLREALLKIGYLNPANPEAILAEWRGLVSRAGPSAREIALLRGLARQVRWAGERVAPPGSGDDNRPPVPEGEA